MTYTEQVYVLIASGDDGASWYYADVRRTHDEAFVHLARLKHQNPDVQYRIRCVAQDLFDALFMRGSAE